MVLGGVFVVDVTARDEQMFDWFRMVRVTNMDGIRWMLGTLNGTVGQVSARNAFLWVARMSEVGLVDRARIPQARGTMVWATPKATGMRRPDLLRQTTRHEVLVSVVSARYLNAGWGWSRDTARREFDHQADGAAARQGVFDLVEVELTAKRNNRYRDILRSFRERLDADPEMRVVYLCTADAARAIRIGLDRGPGQDIASRVYVADVFDRSGGWVGPEYPPGLFDAAAPTAQTIESPSEGVGMWTR